MKQQVFDHLLLLLREGRKIPGEMGAGTDCGRRIGVDLADRGARSGGDGEQGEEVGIRVGLGWDLDGGLVGGWVMSSLGARPSSTSGLK